MDKEAVVTPLCKGLVGNDDDAPINALGELRQGMEWEWFFLKIERDHCGHYFMSLDLQLRC